jgi:AraC-like DNA-binding protein
MENFDRLQFEAGFLPAGYVIERTSLRGPDPSPFQWRPYFIGLNTVSLKADLEFPIHRHSIFEVILVERGPYRCRLNHAPLSLPADALLVVQPGDLHEVSLHRGQRHLILHFTLEPTLAKEELDAGLFASGIAPERQILRPRDRHLASLLRAIGRESARGDGFSALIQDALLAEFFWNLVRTIPDADRGLVFRREAAKEKFRLQLEGLFHARLATFLSVAEMARLLKMSRRSLTAQCQQALGTGPAEAFMHFKLKRAAAWLANTTQSVKTVSFALGFKNPYHFSRVFRARYNLPPSRLRTARLRGEEHSEASRPSLNAKRGSS